MIELKEGRYYLRGKVLNDCTPEELIDAICTLAQRIETLKTTNSDLSQKLIQWMKSNHTR